MSHVVGLNHFNVTVSDMDRSLAFWHGLLGLDLLGRGIVEYPHLDEIVGLDNTRIEWAELALPGGQMIEVFRYHRPVGSAVRPEIPDPGCTHVCLEVQGLDQLVGRLQDAGVDTRSRRAVRIPFGDWKDVRSIYVQDPDGVTVELIEKPNLPQRPES